MHSRMPANEYFLSNGARHLLPDRSCTKNVETLDHASESAMGLRRVPPSHFVLGVAATLAAALAIVPDPRATAATVEATAATQGGLTLAQVAILRSLRSVPTVTMARSVRAWPRPSD